MNMFAKATATAAAALALSGCVGMQSVTPNSDEDSGQGLVYYLPKALIKLTITADKDNQNLAVTAGNPIYVGDPDHAYAFNSVWGPFNADEYTISVSQNGLLNSVELDSDGVLGEFATAIGEASVLLESGISDNANIHNVFETYVDLHELAHDAGALSSLNQRIAAKFAKTDGGVVSTLTLAVSTPGGHLASTGLDRKATPKANCKIGFCYRRLVPYVVETARGGQRFSAIVEIPNGSPTYASAIRRGLTKQWETSVNLTNGVLTKYDVKHGSDLVGIAELPGNFVAGVIGGLTQNGELFTSQSGLIDAQTKRIQAETARLQAVEALKAAQNGGGGGGGGDPIVESGVETPKDLGDEVPLENETEETPDDDAPVAPADVSPIVSPDTVLFVHKFR